MTHFSVGIDIGGTTTRIAVGNERDGAVRIKRFPTQDTGDPESLVLECRRAVDRLLRSAELRSDGVAELGVAVPGSIDIERGIIRTASNLRWKEIPLRSLFESSFGCEVRLENDANAAALGEWHAAGAMIGEGLFAYLTVGTGIGAGFIHDGEIWHGRDGAAGEIGHTTIDRNGPVCPCGNRGCLEAVASGAALERAAREAVAGGLLPNHVRTPSDLAAAAKSGNACAREILDEASEALATAVRNVICLLNPGTICLGGGVILGAGDFTQVRDHALASPILGLRDLRIIRSSLGDDAGVVGALLMGAQQPNGGGRADARSAVGE